MKTLVKFCLIAISFIAIISACETISPQTDFSGKLISKTTCKSGSFVVDSEQGDTLSCIEYEYENGVLHLHHINAGFNCCPGEIFTAFKLINTDSVNTITVTESEREPGCKCNCLYDLDIEIYGVTAKTYYLQIIEPYIGDQQKLEVLLFLANDKSGTICVKRNNYPWAMNR